MKEYYRLLGMRCTSKLRTKIDRALIINAVPSSECYAQISTDWHGLCKLHLEDGMCALQVEQGESQLPDVCRFYPRNAKQQSDSLECSCSNSCEKVIELLMDMKETLEFEENELSFSPEFKVNMSSLEYESCKESVSIIQNRSLTFSERFFSLGNYLKCTALNPTRPVNFYLTFQLMHLFDQYYESNHSISEYCIESQRYFCIEGKDKLSSNDLLLMTEKYDIALLHLESILPNLSLLLEQLIVNHMFYINFPYASGKENDADSFLSLVILHAFLRINILGYMSDKTESADLVNCLAAMFRMIEHSNFNYVAVSLFEMNQSSYEDCVPEMIYL